MEVGVFLLQFPEILEEERLTESTCAVKEVELAVCSVERLGHMHNLSAERSHTGTTTNPDHLLA